MTHTILRLSFYLFLVNICQFLRKVNPKEKSMLLFIITKQLTSVHHQILNSKIKRVTNYSYLNHGDKTKRAAFRARMSKIKNKSGEYVYKLKSSPAYCAYNYLW